MTPTAHRSAPACPSRSPPARWSAHGFGRAGPLRVSTPPLGAPSTPTPSVMSPKASRPHRPPSSASPPPCSTIALASSRHREHATQRRAVARMPLRCVTPSSGALDEELSSLVRGAVRALSLLGRRGLLAPSRRERDVTFLAMLKPRPFLELRYLPPRAATTLPPPRADHACSVHLATSPPRPSCRPPRSRDNSAELLPLT
jgi:hypothetical protein